MEKNREAFVKEVGSGRKTKLALCREYGISRPTGDKWLSRARANEGYSDRSRAPFHTPTKTPSAMEEQIVTLRKERPALGAAKLRRMLQNDGVSDVPARSTINAILHRNGLITREASVAATPTKRFEHKEPNDMWQTDFKGRFPMGNGAYCHPLTTTDDCTRMNLCLDAKSTETLEPVMESFVRMFRTFGLPKTILCDNGNPWGVAQSSGFTRFEVYMMDQDVLVVHGRACHPQTQGKEERFHGTMKREMLRDYTPYDLADAQAFFDKERAFYNEKRPHHAIALQCPADQYVCSPRPYHERVDNWTYDTPYEVRRVKRSGYISYRGQGYFLSEALGEREIGIRASQKEDCVRLVYRGFNIARIDLRERSMSRKIYRILNDPRLPE